VRPPEAMTESTGTQRSPSAPSTGRSQASDEERVQLQGSCLADDDTKSFEVDVPNAPIRSNPPSLATVQSCQRSRLAGQDPDQVLETIDVSRAKLAENCGAPPVKPRRIPWQTTPIA
jgi:hypothetical protein